MKVRDLSGGLVEIPASRHISPFSHTLVGDVVPVTHQWPEVTVTHRGWDPVARDYLDAAYYFGGQVYFPDSEKGKVYRLSFVASQAA